MIIAWWTGKGYLVLFYAFAATLAYGLLINATGGFVPDNRVGWAGAFVAAAALTWRFGSQYNARSRSKALLKKRGNRLFYRARHSFFSMPMETMALLWVGVALYLFATGLVELAHR